MKKKKAEEVVDRSLSLSKLDEEFYFSPSEVELRHKFQETLRNMLPQLGTDENKIILAEVMIALKLEGLIGKELSSRDTKMVKVIKEAIMETPDKKRQALRFAYRLLR